ncbi:MAG TPA: alpha/beta hydrolase [Syntrophales bacterium]|nr:alpha/beta hydrolase [Syntrophales bacterium]
MGLINISKIDYSAFDNPLITASLFYPRPEWGPSISGESVESILVPVDKDVVVGARFHSAGMEAANVLFFHGNGEIVADYNDMGVLYNDIGINFLPVDYRGYGLSTGRPTVTTMMRDCHVIFDYSKKWLRDKGYNGPFIAMGRSLGSASALELASHFKNEIDGIIIESGFAYAAPLLRLLGINMEAIGVKEEQGFRNIDKIRSFDRPTLIIHAEYDHIISFSEGRLLFEACPSRTKKFLKVPGANHNDIFSHGMSLYLESIKWLVEMSAGISAKGN